MKSIIFLFTFLIIQSVKADGGFAGNGILNLFNFNSVTCPANNQYDDSKCDSSSLFQLAGDEAGKSAVNQWLAKPVKASNPFQPANDLMRGPFDVKGPGRNSVFCTKCNNSELINKTIKNKSAAVPDEDMRLKLKQAYLEKQAAAWAERFQGIQNNIRYLQIDADLDGSASDKEKQDINQVASRCNLTKIDNVIGAFIDKQEKLAAKEGKSSCPALKNVDLGQIKKIFKSSSKIKDERLDKYKGVTDSRFESLSSNIAKKSQTTCLNEAVLQKSYSGFHPRAAITLFLSNGNQNKKTTDFIKDIRAAIYDDPKYNFMVQDPKLADELEKFVNKLITEVYAPLYIEYKKALADDEKNQNPDDMMDSFLKRFEPTLKNFDKKAALVIGKFDQDNLGKSVAHLKQECDELLNSHLEAVICHDPKEIDYTDLDLIAGLETTPKLNDCVYNFSLDGSGLMTLTPFCAKFLVNYCKSEPVAYQSSLSEQDKIYRNSLGNIHTKMKNFQSLKTTMSGEKAKTSQDIDEFNKDFCTPIYAKCKSLHPDLKEDSLEFRRYLERLAFEKLSKGEYQASLENNPIVRNIKDYSEAVLDVKVAVKSSESNGTNFDENKMREEGSPVDVVYGNSDYSNGNKTGSSSSIRDSIEGENGPTYIGVGDDPLIGKSVDKNTEENTAPNSSTTSANSAFNKPTVNPYVAPVSYRAPEEIKKDEKILDANKDKISSMKNQLSADKSKLIASGKDYKSDPDYLEKEKKLKELEEKTKDLERKLLAEKDQRIKELEKLLAGKKEGDKDYKKLYEELNRTIDSKNSIGNVNGQGVDGRSNNSISGIYGNNIAVTPTSNSSGSNSSSFSPGYIGASGSSGLGSGANNVSSSSGGGANFVTTQSSKPSDVPVITLTTEEFKSINHPNMENVRKAVEEILKKHNGSVIGNRLYVQTKDEKGQIIYQSIDLKVLKVGINDKNDKIALKKDDKKIEPKKEKSPRRPSATVQELENALK